MKATAAATPGIQLNDTVAATPAAAVGIHHGAHDEVQVTAATTATINTASMAGAPVGDARLPRATRPATTATATRIAGPNEPVPSADSDPDVDSSRVVRASDDDRSSESASVITPTVRALRFAARHREHS